MTTDNARKSHAPVHGSPIVAAPELKRHLGRAMPQSEASRTPVRAAAKKVPSKKTPSKKTPAKKTPAKKTPAKKAPATTSFAKKAVSKKTASTPPAAKKSAAKTIAAKKPITKKQIGKKPANRRPKGSGTAKAISLHIGLNGVSGLAYGGWDGPLAACEFDANDMTALATAQGMAPTTLLTRKATRAAVLAAMRAAAAALIDGDLFFMSYSGHGGQVPDVSGDEDDKQDETWCLYDGQLIDDEIYFELSHFEAGVRVLVVSDSCHSGTVTRDVMMPPVTVPTQRPKLMPASVAMRTYREHQQFYDKLQLDVAAASAKANAKRAASGRSATDPDSAIARVAVSSRLGGIVKTFDASVVLLSGCQDNQTSMDGEHNGAFTEQLLKVWDQGRYSGNYAVFYSKIRARMPATQSPNLFTLGDAGAFLAQSPFLV